MRVPASDTPSAATTRNRSAGPANSRDSARGSDGMPDTIPPPVLLPSRRPVARLILLSDRSPEQALPSVLAVGLDLKVEPLSVDSLARLPDLGPEAVLVDAA